MQKDKTSNSDANDAAKDDDDSKKLAELVVEAVRLESARQNATLNWSLGAMAACAIAIWMGVPPIYLAGASLAGIIFLLLRRTRHNSQSD